MGLQKLKPAKGATHRNKRVGRGPGSHGKTAGRGNKGQKSRSGSRRRPGFEGGQMPLHRRLPKRGFTNVFRKEFAIVNVGQLAVFPEGTKVGPEELHRAGLVKRKLAGIKVLGDGEPGKALTVVAHKFSKEAKKKIEAAQGQAVVAT